MMTRKPVPTVWKRDKGTQGNSKRHVCGCGFKTDDYWAMQAHNVVQVFIKNGREESKLGGCENDKT